jgi:hypothetical protein
LTAVLNVITLALAGICILAALAFFVRGIQARLGGSEQLYGVARQEARRGMLVSFMRGFLLLIVGLILLGVYGLTTRPEVTEEAQPPTRTVTATSPAEATMTAAISTTPTSTRVVGISPTSPLASQTPAPTETSPPTETPVVATALVNSPNGLWLRESPGGTQEVELIPDGSVLVLLPGREFADDSEWQQVRTAAGNEGWVAVDFIIYQ